MIEQSALHILLGSLWTYLLISLASVAVAKGWLMWRRRRVETADAFDSPRVFAALVAAGALPILWTGSSLIHSFEDPDAWVGMVGIACPHFEVFPGAELWAAILASIALIWRGVVRPARILGTSMLEERRRGASRLSEDDPLAQKLRRLCQQHEALEEVADRIVPVTGIDTACRTRGWLSPRIEVRCEAIAEWDESELVGALLHEVSHRHSLDPFRQTLVFLARHWNPFGWVLESERGAWRYARELNCDARAVARGADPLSLASALVSAARPAEPCHHLHSVGLDGCGADAIETRVQILMGYSEKPPAQLPSAGSAGWMLLSGPVLAAALLPHLIDGLPLPVHSIWLWAIGG